MGKSCIDMLTLCVLWDKLKSESLFKKCSNKWVNWHPYGSRVLGIRIEDAWSSQLSMNECSMLRFCLSLFSLTLLDVDGGSVARVYLLRNVDGNYKWKWHLFDIKRGEKNTYPTLGLRFHFCRRWSLMNGRLKWIPKCSLKVKNIIDIF